MDDGRRWAEFVAFCRGLESRRRPGRTPLRRQWGSLWDLFKTKVQPHLTEKEIQQLLGKRLDQLDPEENDLKALTAHAVGRGLVHPEELRNALANANDEAPLYFLAGLSGKAFGESVAPELCRFWLQQDGDAWDKRPSTDYYDVGWTPHETGRTLRIELKASSEYPAYRFQQIRDPRINARADSAYDAVLCLGVTAGTVEFWLIPSGSVSDLIDKRILIPQHGGRKAGLESNTYWIMMTPENRWHLAEWHVESSKLREVAQTLVSSKLQ